jgi:hypothetical protein
VVLPVEASTRIVKQMAGQVRAWGARIGGSPRPSVVVCTLMLLCSGIHFVALLRQVVKHGAFVGDDVVGFWMARTKTWWDFTTTPNDVHFIPLHRLLALAVYRVAPMNFFVGELPLVLFHLGAMFLLYRYARSLIPVPAAVVLVCLYGVNACLGCLFIWWTAGMHRLPCVFFVIAAISAHLKYCESGKVRWLVVSSLATALALGFYIKAVLIPLYIVSLETCLWFCVGANRSVRRLSMSLGACFAAIFAFVWGWHVTTTPDMQHVTPNVAFALHFMISGVHLFLPSMFGSWLSADPVAYYPAIAAWISLVVVTVALAPRTVVCWICLFLCVATNMALIGFSNAKTQQFGYAILWGDRYYFENAFLFVIFVSVTINAVCMRASVTRGLRSGPAVWVTIAFLMMSMSAVARRGYVTFLNVQKTFYAGSYVAKTFYDNVRDGVSRIPGARSGPIFVRDSRIPEEIIPGGLWLNSSVRMLRLMGIDARNKWAGPYLVGHDGRVFSLVQKRWL